MAPHKDMFGTRGADWYFIIPASLVWTSALIVTAWDFIQVQRGIYHFELINLVGLISMLAGVILRVIARNTLGGHFYWGLRTLEEHRLIKHGIYQLIRHPAYTGSLLFSLGAPLSFSSSYGFMVMLLLVPCILYRIEVEERMLLERFGSEYLEYAMRTKKLIPYIY